MLIHQSEWDKTSLECQQMILLSSYVSLVEQRNDYLIKHRCFIRYEVTVCAQLLIRKVECTLIIISLLFTKNKYELP